MAAKKAIGNAKSGIEKGIENLKERLTPEQYQICVLGETEAAFTGKLLHNKEKGAYCCTVCGKELFSSKTKFDSGTGWPSFFKEISGGNVKLIKDKNLGMQRTEVRCSSCGSHLGHVFDGGPKPTGKRFCINSVALEFKPEKQVKKIGY